jgi:transposase
MESMFQAVLNLPHVRVIEATKSDSGEWTLRVESTRSSARCKRCGSEAIEFHSLGHRIRLRHLPIFNQPVYIEIRPKRYRCSVCEGGPTTTQRADWYDERSPNTKAYDEWLLLSLVNSTLSDTARKLSVSEEVVEGALDRQMSTEVKWSEYARLDLLGIDEIALRKGHRSYVTLVTMPLEEGGLAVLAVLKGRSKETLEAFFDTMPEALIESITRVCVDMNEGYISAVKAKVPAAEIIVDRFHVAKQYREAADTVRKVEMKRLKKELGEHGYAELKGAMWPFRKRPEELEPKEQDVLERVFEKSPKLRSVYELRQELTSIFERELSKGGAKCAMRAWIKRVRESGLSCFDRFIGTLEKRLDEITNYFTERETSGFVEGFNNKVKVLKRRCYGIYDLGRLFQRLTLDLEGYRLFGPSARHNI